jgi:hypothetical protein
VRRFIARSTYLGACSAIAAAIWACASSGGGISGTSIVGGPIDQFGSILVNGIEFETTNAIVTIEGDPATVDDLRLGMFVFVRGPVDRDSGTGVADRVASDHLLEAPVDAVNAVDGTFVALSQLVITDASTVFDQVTLATLAPGDVVEVFGVRDADLSIRATRVERKQGVTEFEVTGTIQNVDTVEQTFAIGLLTVDFSDAVVENAPPTGLTDGLLVEVETEEAPVDDAVSAVGVEVIDPNLGFEEGDDAEFLGFVTEIVSPSEFVLNTTQRVLVTDSTRFENGTRDDLVLNAEVEVEGPIDTTGAVTAEEIEFVSP